MTVSFLPFTVTVNGSPFSSSLGFAKPAALQAEAARVSPRTGESETSGKPIPVFIQYKPEFRNIIRRD
jgi:hypothetical protein